tara:strand:+ start:529 stop:717 length:189 start_codon:yes stop_codon:yes gene_type:complete
MDAQLIACPYCGEPLEVALDPSVRHQEYVEDCQVCCRPMILTVVIDPDTPDDAQVSVRREDD